MARLQSVFYKGRTIDFEKMYGEDNYGRYKIMYINAYLEGKFIATGLTKSIAERKAKRNIDIMYR